MTASDDSYTDSLDYKVGQKVRSWRLKRGYTQEDLAKEIGVIRQVVLQYEKGTRRISIEKLYAIAEALSVSVTDLIPLSNEKICLKDEEILNLVREYKKIKDQELRKVFYLLSKSAQLSEKSSRKAERIEIAKNLVKAGISIDIVSKTIGLSANECTNGSIYYKIGKKVKEWRLVREYTQEDLAKKIGVTRHKISKYEQGETAVPLDKLYEIAEALSVNVKALLPKTRKDEDSKEENKLLSLIKALLPKTTECENEDSKKLLSLINEYRETENEESQGVLDALVKSLSKGMQTSKEKVKKAEKIKVAKNLVKVGVAVDIILRTTGLSSDEIDR